MLKPCRPGLVRNKQKFGDNRCRNPEGQAAKRAEIKVLSAGTVAHASLTRMREELEQQMEQIRQQHNRLQQAHTTARTSGNNAKIEQLQQQHNALKQQHNALNQQRNANAEKIKSLEAALAEERRRRQNGNNEKTELQQQRNASIKSLLLSIKRAKELEALQTGLEATIAEERRKRENGNKQIASLLAEHGDKNKQIAVVKAALANAERKLIELEKNKSNRNAETQRVIDKQKQHMIDTITALKDFMFRMFENTNPIDPDKLFPPPSTTLESNGSVKSAPKPDGSNPNYKLFRKVQQTLSSKWYGPIADTLQVELEPMVRKLATLRAGGGPRLLEMQQRIAELQQKLDALRQQRVSNRAAYRQQLNALTQQRTSNQAAHRQQLDALTQQLTSNQAAHQQQLEALTQRYQNELENELEKFKEQYRKTCQDELDRVDEALRELLAQKDAIKQDYEALKLEYIRLAGLQASTPDLVQHIDQLSTQLRNTMEQLDTVSEERNALQKRLEEVTEWCNRRIAELKGNNNNNQGKKRKRTTNKKTYKDGKQVKNNQPEKKKMKRQENASPSLPPLPVCKGDAKVYVRPAGSSARDMFKCLTKKQKKTKTYKKWEEYRPGQQWRSN